MNPPIPADDSHLREEKIDSEQVFRGKLLDVRRDHVRLPNGGTATREYVVHPGAVLIVPMLDDGRLVVERQYRYPLSRVLIEFPEVHTTTLDELLAPSERGEITDAKTLIALLWLQNWQSGRWKVSWQPAP